MLTRLAALVSVCLHNALATERLKLAGLIDALNGVHNRRYFASRCLQELLAAQRSDKALACLLQDANRARYGAKQAGRNRVVWEPPRG